MATTKKAGRPPKTLKDFTFEQIEKFTHVRAERLCHRHRIRSEGSLGVLRHRLRCAKEKPKAICCCCGEVGHVVKTEPVAHGVSRTMKCPNGNCRQKWTWYADTRNGASQ